MAARGSGTRQNESTAGFTLLELSAALFVLTVGLFGVFQLYMFGVHRGRAINEAALANRAAQNEIETLRALPFSQLTPRTEAAFTGDAPNLEGLVNAKGRLTIRDLPGYHGRLKEATVVVQWRGDRGRRIEKRLTTLIADHGGT